jgi:Phage protein Gp138 N-terminal domain
MTVLPSTLDLQEAEVRNTLSDLHTCMPGEVVAVRSGADQRQFVDVLPMLRRAVIDEHGEPVDEALPVLQMVPVAHWQGGGFFVSMPLQPGDPVLLAFAERSLDTWIQNAKPGARTAVTPGDVATHSLQGAIALPCGPAPRARLITGVDGSDMVVGTLSGTILARFQSDGSVVFAEGVNFVALANLVKAELDRIWTVLGSHTHPVSGSSAGSSMPPIVDRAGSVAATKTKAT